MESQERTLFRHPTVNRIQKQLRTALDRQELSAFQTATTEALSTRVTVAALHDMNSRVAKLEQSAQPPPQRHTHFNRYGPNDPLLASGIPRRRRRQRGRTSSVTVGVAEGRYRLGSGRLGWRRGGSAGG